MTFPEYSPSLITPDFDISSELQLLASGTSIYSGLNFKAWLLTIIVPISVGFTQDPALLPQDRTPSPVLSYNYKRVPDAGILSPVRGRTSPLEHTESIGLLRK